jgi:hypothetical protein
MNDVLVKDILRYIHDYEHPKRIALSKRYPLLKKPLVMIHQAKQSIKDRLNFNISVKRLDTCFPCIIARHQSVLRRKLGDSDPVLQSRKITNFAPILYEFDERYLAKNDYTMIDFTR